MNYGGPLYVFTFWGCFEVASLQLASIWKGRGGSWSGGD